MFQSLLSISASSLKHSFYICQRKRFFLPSLKINSRLRQNHVAHVVKYQELENTAISIYSVWIYHLTNGPQFSMVYTLIDHRNDVIKCSKLQGFEHFVASFLWSIRVQTMENCGRFVFYSNIYFFYEKTRRTKQPALRDMLRHFHGLYSHTPQLSTNQRARIRSVIVIFIIDHNQGFEKNVYEMPCFTICIYS